MADPEGAAHCTTVHVHFVLYLNNYLGIDATGPGRLADYISGLKCSRPLSSKSKNPLHVLAPPKLPVDAGFQATATSATLPEGFSVCARPLGLRVKRCLRPY